MSHKHVYLIYSWGEKKEIVEALGKYLHDVHKYDVCRDETGSTLMGAMSGDTHKWVAEAIEKSHTIFVCVSKHLQRSPLMDMELAYAYRLVIQGILDLVFCMVDEDFTTVSSPDRVVGKLAMWIFNLSDVATSPPALLLGIAIILSTICRIIP